MVVVVWWWCGGGGVDQRIVTHRGRYVGVAMVPGNTWVGGGRVGGVSNVHRDDGGAA